MMGAMRWPWVLPLALVLMTPVVQAQSLNRKALVSRLRHIPVFVITGEGGRLGAFRQPGRNRDLLPFFLARSDLERFLERRKDISGPIRIQEFNLGQVYELILRLRENKERKLEVTVVPSSAQVDHALRILRSQGVNSDKFSGVPVFLLVRKPDDSLLQVAVKAGKREILYQPVFLSYGDAEGFWQILRKSGAPGSDKVYIQVTNLDLIVREMERGSKSVEVVYFIPMGGLQFFLRLLSGRH